MPPIAIPHTSPVTTQLSPFVSPAHADRAGPLNTSPSVPSPLSPNACYEEQKTRRDERRRHYTPLQKAARYMGFPAVMLGSALSAGLMAEHGVPVAGIPVITTIASLATVVGMEKLIPFNTNWNIRKEDLLLDGAHNLISTAGFVSLVKSLIAPGVVTLALAGAQYLGNSDAAHAVSDVANTILPGASNVASWHPITRFSAFLLATEALTYFAHRFVVHEFEPGWYFHRVHHRPEVMNTLKAGVNNAVDALKELSHFVLPVSAMVMLSGNTPETMHAIAATTATIVAMTTAKGFAQHSNGDFELGFLEYVLSGVKAHRWHHAKDERRNTNYGINLTLFDTLSAVPETILNRLLKHYPKASTWPGVARLRAITRYANSLYLPDKETPDEVGSDVNVVKYPVDPHASWHEQFKASCKQFIYDTINPVELSLRWVRDKILRAHPEKQP